MFNEKKHAHEYYNIHRLGIQARRYSEISYINFNAKYSIYAKFNLHSLEIRNEHR